MAQDNSSSSSVAQRCQKVGHPWGKCLVHEGGHLFLSLIYVTTTRSCMCIHTREEFYLPTCVCKTYHAGSQLSTVSRRWSLHARPTSSSLIYFRTKIAGKSHLVPCLHFTNEEVEAQKIIWELEVLPDPCSLEGLFPNPLSQSILPNVRSHRARRGGSQCAPITLSDCSRHFQFNGWALAHFSAERAELEKVIRGRPVR